LEESEFCSSDIFRLFKWCKRPLFCTSASGLRLGGIFDKKRVLKWYDLSYSTSLIPSIYGFVLTLTSMPIIYSLKLVFNIANGPECLSGLGDTLPSHWTQTGHLFLYPFSALIRVPPRVIRLTGPPVSPQTFNVDQFGRWVGRGQGLGMPKGSHAKHRCSAITSTKFD